MSRTSIRYISLSASPPPPLFYRIVESYHLYHWIAKCIPTSTCQLSFKSDSGLFVCLFVYPGWSPHSPWGTHANPWKIHGPFQAHTNAHSDLVLAWIASIGLLRCILAQMALTKARNGFDQSKQLQEMEENSKEREKREKPTPNNIVQYYSYTHSKIRGQLCTD